MKTMQLFARTAKTVSNKFPNKTNPFSTLKNQEPKKETEEFEMQCSLTGVIKKYKSNTFNLFSQNDMKNQKGNEEPAKSQGKDEVKSEEQPSNGFKHSN